MTRTMDINKDSPNEICLDEFLNLLKTLDASSSSRCFSFLIGAGASVESGIRSGGELAAEWLKQISEFLDKEPYGAWLGEKGIDPDLPAEHYTEIYDRRFLSDPNTGYDVLIHEMKDAEPSIGYPLLAKVLADTNNNIAITTNFDSLIESSIYRYTNSNPILISHESLAAYVSASTNQPTIAKVHRDLFFDPQNSSDDVNELKGNWSSVLTGIFDARPTIVVGYGGNDPGLMKLITGLKNKNRKPIYWCVRGESTISEKTKHALNNSDYIIKIDGFDQLMLAIANVYELHITDVDNPENSPVLSEAKTRVNRFNEQIKKFGEQDTQSNELVQTQSPKWMKLLLAAYFEEDIKKKDQLYLKAIIDFPENADVLGNYANFLKTEKKDNAKAEEVYLKAIEADPKHANNLGRYANFLCDEKKDNAKAEEVYLKAIEADPKNATNLGNYANFLYNQKKDNAKAEEVYLKAIEVDPKHANNLGNYANFLCNQKKDNAKAEEYYLKAIEVDPKHATTLGNYANFLWIQKKDNTKAEEVYLKAIEADPKDANNFGNYSGLLFVLGRSDEASKWLHQARKMAKISDENVLLLELLFYELVHLNIDTKSEMDDFLSKGLKSIGFDLSPHVLLAKAQNHLKLDAVIDYAAQISEE